MRYEGLGRRSLANIMLNLSWVDAISLLFNIFAIYQLIINRRDSSKERNVYFEQLEAILRTIRQNAVSLTGNSEWVNGTDSLDSQAKFGLILKNKEEICRWTAVANTVFGLMKSVDTERLKKFPDYLSYTKLEKEIV